MKNGAKYRTNGRIVADLLSAAVHPDEDEGGVGITTIIRKGNLSYARATDMVQKLVRAGLLAEADYGYVVTPDGIRYLKAYQDFQGFANSFGLRL